MRPDAKSATLPARVQRVRRRLTDDTVRCHFYHRPTRRRLPDPANPDFAAAYEAAERKFAEVEKLEAAKRAETKVAAPPLAPQTQPQIASSSEYPLGRNHKEVYYTPEELVVRWRRRVDVGTLANWRSKRQGPPFHRFGRAVLYRADLVEQWESKNMTICDRVSVIGREDETV